jgi:hypothetical protein
LYWGEPKHVAQKFPNNKTYKVQNIILNEKYVWKTNLFSVIKGLLTKQQYFKKTKGLFLPQNLVLHFTVHVNICIVGCVTHVEALVDSDVTSYFIDENFVQQKYFQLL